MSQCDNCLRNKFCSTALKAIVGVVNSKECLGRRVVDWYEKGDY